MNVTSFAKAHGLRVVKERRAVKKAMLLDGRPKPDAEHVPGKHGWITDARTAMGAFVLTHSASSLIARANALGVTLAACGDREIGLYFNPTDPAQAEFAIRAIKGRRKRRVRVTPELLARLRATREARRMPVLA
jgi:hypothetical protein